MKVTVLPFVLAALGLAVQISASPIRIYILSPEHPDINAAEHPERNVDAAVTHMRWGLAAADATQAVPQSRKRPMIGMIEDFGHHGAEGSVHNDFIAGERMNSLPMTKHHCGGDGMRMKAIAFSNWLREKVGLPPISPPYTKFYRGHPMTHYPERVHYESATPVMTFHPASHFAEGDGDVDLVGVPRFHRIHSHHHPHPHQLRSSTFAGRLQKALMTLSPWEGRAVAFVIGCGIGSLLRMFYVLVVLAYRTYASRRDEEVEGDIVFAEVEEFPPRYVDEKTAPVNEKGSA